MAIIHKLHNLNTVINAVTIITDKIKIVELYFGKINIKH